MIAISRRVRRGRTPGHLLLPFGQFTLSHPTVIFNRFRCCWIWTRNAHPTMSYAAAGQRCRFDLKKLFQKNLKKGLTKRGFCYILNKSSAMSHQKRQQLNKMESWLSGRRRTIGNRVGVMSVSRVQIPNSPPQRAEIVRFQLFLHYLSRNYSFADKEERTAGRSKVVRKFLCRNFLPPEVKKPRYMLPVFSDCRAILLNTRLRAGCEQILTSSDCEQGMFFYFPENIFFGVDHLWSIFYPFRR